MKIYNTSLIRVLLFLQFLIPMTHSHSKPTQQPISEILNRFLFQETQMKLSGPLLISAVLCFMAASISSAGGIGGGGLFIPILNIVAGLDLKKASSFSAFMVTGGSVANVMCQMFLTSPKFGRKTLIDYDIALLSEPGLLLGVSIGVVFNLMFPEWLITILFAVFLACSTFKTCKSGVCFWKLESEEGNGNGCEEIGNGLLVKDSRGCEGNCLEEPLLMRRETGQFTLVLPWMKLGVLAMVWLSFFSIYILRGNSYGEGMIAIEPCGEGYWILSALQLPLAMVFTTCIFFTRETNKDEASCLEEREREEHSNEGGPSNKLIFPVMALLAGVLGGLFGIGGGMLISPLLLQVGIPPEITAATCSFMVLFSSSMSAVQYLLLGMEDTDIALSFGLVCFVASLIGSVIVQRAVRKHGRASLIVFSVGTVMALSTVLITSFGALHVWKDYRSGKFMGFKSPC